MSDLRTDLLVIGGGSGGLSIAAGASQMGARVVLLEGAEMGGDCLNYGCVPSKALLAAAHKAHSIKTTAPFGTRVHGADIDFAAAQAHVRKTVAAIAPHDSQERFESLGVHVVRAFGSFVGPNTVQAGDTRITARRIVIATGSRALIPPIPGLDSVPYLTNESIFDVEGRPAHLVIVGGGPIGLEMAQAHHRLGSKVTVIEAKSALANDDPELAAIAIAALRDEGIDIQEGTSVDKVSAGSDGIIVSTSAGEISGSHLLIAAGRRASIEGLNLAAAGVEHTQRGVTVDQYLRTSNRRVYAIGDVTGGAQFTHVAGYQAGQIARSILFSLRSKVRTDCIPWCTYTDPELAHVGLSEAKARARFKDRLSVVRSEFSASDRAVAQGQTRGLIKVMIVKGRPVGASIVGPMAGELIAMWSMAIALRLKMSAISATILPYPTMMEINKRAASAYFSPLLFENNAIKRIVRLVQRIIP